MEVATREVKVHKEDGLISFVLFQHLFFLMEVATSLCSRGFLVQLSVSTPFLPNGSRYRQDDHIPNYDVWLEFQHLFFLTEVATSEISPRDSVFNKRKFQHLFFLTEVATHHQDYQLQRLVGLF